MKLRFRTPALVEHSDDALALSAQEGDLLAQQVLIERYRRFARAKARSYFLMGGERDDVEQEALIGLYKAIRDYRTDREASFRAFAELCINRQMITAIKTATRLKHQPLNSYVSISGVWDTDDAGERVLENLLDDHRAPDPAEHVVSIESLVAMRSALARILSGLEVDVLRLYVEGKTYQEIGTHLGRHTKSIDNAIQRIKRKVEVHLDTGATEELAVAAS